VRSIIIATLLAAALTAGAPAQAEKAGELKVGYVNIERLLRDAPLAIRAQKKLEEEFVRREQELAKLESQAKAAQLDYEKNAMTMSESARRERERDLAELNREFARKKREFNEDLTERRNQELSNVIERANKAVKQIAESEKFDLILQDAVFVSQRLDITDKVIKALGDAREGAK
jgi:outer membrane protein